MQKIFLKNIFLLILINILIKPFYLFGIDAQVQNTIGAESYGLYFALFNFIFLFQIILDPGIQNYNLKNLSQNRENINSVFPSIFGFKLILSCLFLSIVSIVGFIIYPNSYFPILILLVFTQISSSLYLYLRSNFSALGMFKTDAILSGLDKLIMIFLIGYFLLNNQMSILLFVQLQLIAYLICIIIVSLLLKNKTILKPKFSLASSKELLKKTAPYGLVFLLMTLYTRMDGVMLERLLDDNAYQAGIYAASYRLLDAVNMFGFLFASLLLPMFARMIKLKQNLQALIDIALPLILMLAISVILSSLFYGEQIIELIYKNTNEQYYTSLKILLCSFLAIGISYIYGTLITASGELKTFNFIFIIGIAINWILNIILIPKHGAIGAAFATCGTQFFVMIAQLILAFYKFQLKINWYSLSKFIFLCFIGYLLFFGSTIFNFLSWELNLLFSLFILTILSILIGFVRFKWIFGMAFE